jgi:hypothetical protein
MSANLDEEEGQLVNVRTGSKEGKKGLAERESNKPCSFLPSATSQWNDVISNMNRLKGGLSTLV